MSGGRLPDASGTTSNPKGVLLTHGNMVYSGYYGDWETSMTASDRMLTTMPACHSNFQLAALTPVLTARATLIVVEKYSASRFWSQVREYRATLAQCVAMMLRTLMLQPTDPDERDHSLRDMLYFLPVSAREKEAFEERFGASTTVASERMRPISAMRASIMPCSFLASS